MKAAYGYKNDDELAKSGSRASKRSLKRNGSRSSARSSHSVKTPIGSRKQRLDSRKNLKAESNQGVHVMPSLKQSNEVVLASDAAIFDEEHE
jgi:hypothetical protein